MTDTTRAVWIDGDPLMETIAAAIWEHCTTEGTSIVRDDPRNIAAVVAAMMPPAHACPPGCPGCDAPGGVGECGPEDRPAPAPRNALSAPQTVEPPAPGPERHPGGENGPHTGTQRAELCRQFKAAITRRWDVGPFVVDEIVDDAVDCHLDLVARATANLLADSHRQAEEAEAALARVRALHQPHPEGGIGHLPDGGYGDISPACAACGTHDEYAVPWPCPTIRALDAPQAGDDTTGATP